MEVSLWDMDIEYNVRIDCNADGVDYIEIDMGEEHSICLTEDNCRELARVLNFLADEIAN